MYHNRHTEHQIQYKWTSVCSCLWRALLQPQPYGRWCKWCHDSADWCTWLNFTVQDTILQPSCIQSLNVERTGWSYRSGFHVHQGMVYWKKEHVIILISQLQIIPCIRVRIYNYNYIIIVHHQCVHTFNKVYKPYLTKYFTKPVVWVMENLLGLPMKTANSYIETRNTVLSQLNWNSCTAQLPQSGQSIPSFCDFTAVEPLPPTHLSTVNPSHLY